MKPLSRIAVIGSIVLACGEVAMASGICTYETWDWDTVQRQAVNHRRVTKAKSALTSEERGPYEGCTVCLEDQALIRIGRLPPIQVCKTLKDRMARAIEKAVSEGFPIETVIGYRVGKSRGPVNAAGLRTQFSNHSYGTAIDFNAEKNGLYDNCLSFGGGCRLIRGGEYRVGEPGVIDRRSSLYKAMLKEGFKWGGEINGKQKDFMHFSLDGM